MFYFEYDTWGLHDSSQATASLPTESGEQF